MINQLFNFIAKDLFYKILKNKVHTCFMLIMVNNLPIFLSILQNCFKILQKHLNHEYFNFKQLHQSLDTSVKFYKTCFTSGKGYLSSRIVIL